MLRKLFNPAQIALLSGLLFSGVAGCKREEVSLPEIPRSALALKEGHLYRNGQASPFNGFVIERYPGGAIESRSAVSNGLLHGASEGWHTNGTLQVRENFEAGFSHGLRTKWFTSGAKQSEAMIEHGKLNGTFRRWDEKGTLVEQIELRNDKPDGLSIAYYPDGSVKARVRMGAGVVVERENFKPGELREPPVMTAAKK